MAAKLGVGVVGVGMLGRRHAANLAHRIPEASLVAVADARPEVAREVAAELEAPRWFAAAEELAADPAVDALVIAANAPAHAEGILAAARHRKDVFCEKPLTTTLADADAALAAVAAAGVRLQVGFMRRYDPAYASAKRQIEAGRIGAPVLFKGVHRDRLPVPPAYLAGWPEPRDSSIFLDSGVHDYDLARWLMEDEVAAVTAATAVVPGSALAALGGVDSAVSTLRFAGGALGDVEIHRAARYAYDTRTEVVGTEGAVFVGGGPATAWTLATADGALQDTPDHWLTRYGAAFLIELEDWVRRMRAGEPPFVTGADGRAAVEIAVAAAQSQRDGVWVRLPLPAPGATPT